MDWISVEDRLPTDGDIVLGVENFPEQSKPCVLEMSYTTSRGFEYLQRPIECSNVSHWMPLPPPPTPTLTPKEALREAIGQLESIHRMCRKHAGERLTDRGGYYIEAFYMDGANALLPRLRAALESE